MARVICPFCLKPHDFKTSPVCQTYPEQTVPSDYITEYDRVAPLWLLTVGFKQHGKTTYLAALTLVLENMSSVWEGMFDSALDQETTHAIQQMRRDAMKGDVPKETNLQVPRPLLLGLHGLPDSGARNLVMYDVAGEIFDSINEVHHYLAAIKQVSTTWFLVSLPDLERDQEGRAITDLFTAYRSGMRKLQADLKGRNLIVVYTKADQVSFSPEIESYLEMDPYQGLTLADMQLPPFDPFSLPDYSQRMQTVSDQLEEYTRRHVKKGANFINMVKAEGMNLYFSAVSALGQSPDSPESRLREKARRFRVLDPFLWALLLQMQPTAHAVSLVIDAADGGAEYAKLVSTIWEGVSNHADITTYALGTSQPKSQPGQQPPLRLAPQSQARLIGPILEQSPPETRVLILAAGRIIDLGDFVDSAWRDRILVVQTDEQPTQWPQTWIYRSDNDLGPLVQALLGR